MSGLTEEEIAAREEARLNRITAQKGRGGQGAKKNIFGGGLEAARQGHGGAPKSTLPTTTTSIPIQNRPSSLSTGSRAHPPPVHQPTRVEEIPIQRQHQPQHHEPQRPTYHHDPTRQTIETNVPDRGLFKDEDAARREEERMSRTFGNLVLDDPPPAKTETFSTHAVARPVTSQPSTTTYATPVSHAPVNQTQSYSQPHTTHHTTAPVHAPVHQTQSHTTVYQPPAQTQSHKPTPAKQFAAPMVAQYGTEYETILLNEIQLARSNPDVFIQRLSARLRNYDGQDYRDEETGIAMATQEGASAVQEAIDYLQRMPSLGSHASLRLEDGLSQSSRDFCNLCRDTLAPKESQDEARARLTKYGQYYGDIVQNVAFSNVPQQHLILDWIIDDGQVGRPHRLAIFNPEMRFIGISSGPHTVGRVICVLLSAEYIPKSSNQPAPAPVYPNVPPVVNTQPEHVYPAYVVNQLIATDDGTANILPISHLGCEANELKLTLLNNGSVIEFQRSVIQGGRPRTEIQKFNLPYQVTQRTCTAVYFPARNGGELYIHLGKQLSAIPNGEYEITRFTIMANHNSTEEKVKIQIDQTSDRIRFWPGASSRHTTEFVVVLVGANLEFRSSYSYEDGDAIKTINGKQTVTLPVPPSPQQIEVRGTDVLIYSNKPTSDSLAVPDTIIPIKLG